MIPRDSATSLHVNKSMASVWQAVCMWPPATVWRTAFRKHYGSSSPSKWHQLYVDVSCVLLGVKSALLVDCVSPSNEKLKLYLKDVAQHESCSSSRDCRTVDSDHGPKTADSEFRRCIKNCCILTIGEDTLLVNMESLAHKWSLPQRSAEDKVSDCEHSELGHATCTFPTRDCCVFVDVTKGMRAPKLLQDQDAASMKNLFIMWLEKVRSSYLASDKTNMITIIPCSSNIELLASSQRQLDQTLNSVSQRENLCCSTCIAGDDLQSDVAHTVLELNVCTLFGLLLGYPIVYCFDTERGYSLDMVDLICYTLTIRSSNSAQSDSSITLCLKFEKVHVHNF